MTAVDGVNVISGETGAWGQSGYVFSPGESYEIAGWRKSDAEIADFNFTSAGNSYAERTGRPANVGVIGVALFFERPARVPSYEALDRPSMESATLERVEGGADGAARAAAPSPGAAASSAPKLEEVKPYSVPPNNITSMAPAQKLGTGHGARETSYVQNTTFDRLSSTPNEVIKIRYDSYENLAAMGVVPARPDGNPRQIPSPSRPCRGMYRTRRAADNGVNEPIAGD